LHWMANLSGPEMLLFQGYISAEQLHSAKGLSPSIRPFAFFATCFTNLKSGAYRLQPSMRICWTFLHGAENASRRRAVRSSQGSGESKA
jgi:hypothetical protein